MTRSLATLPRCARLFSSSTRQSAPPRQPQWPQLKRRGRASDEGTARVQHHNEPVPNGKRQRELWKNNPWYEEASQQDKKFENAVRGNTGVELTQLVPEEYKNGVTVQREIRTEPGKNMLLVGGLSTNLTARDFYRLAPSSLADWDSSIKMVQQQRDPRTLEPLGIYQLSFSSAEAAALYFQTLDYAHQTARAKTTSSFELDTPHRGAGPTGADAFTIAPPSMTMIPAKLQRVSQKYPWQKQLMEFFDDMSQPPIVLLDIYPPRLTLDQLKELMKLDEQKRGDYWKTEKVIDLNSSQQGETNDNKGNGAAEPAGEDQETGSEEDASQEREGGQESGNKSTGKPRTSARSEMLKGRFLLSFAFDMDAARFHRHWSGRTLSVTEVDGSIAYYKVDASMLRW